MNLRGKVVKARRALLNGSGELSYLEARGIAKKAVGEAFVGYEFGVFLYPCRAKSTALLALFVGYRSEPWAAERRGACYAQLQAVADAAGMDGERAEGWARLAASIPLSEHPTFHILGALTEDAT